MKLMKNCSMILIAGTLALVGCEQNPDAPFERSSSSASTKTAPSSSAKSKVPSAPAKSGAAAAKAVDVSKMTLGADLSPNNTVASDDQTEANSVGPYVGTYDAQLKSVSSKTEPGSVGTGSYCLKISTDQENRSGIRHLLSLFETQPNKRYLISCKVFCAKDQSAIRLGVLDSTAGNIWAKSLDQGKLDYQNKPGEWTTLQGIVTMPPNAEGKTQMWILNWTREPMTWYLDDLSMKEITKE